ncbi:hypothetical protein ACWD26_32970 [Streptomyces sp. NPDC002787]
MAKRTPARPGAIAAVAVAVLALGGLQGSTAGAQTVEAVSSPSTTCHGTQPKGGGTGDSGDGGPEDDTPMYRTLGHVGKLVTGRYAAVHTGLVLDEDEASVDIYRIPSKPFDTAVCEAAEKGVTVRLHDRDINENDLNALLDRQRGHDPLGRYLRHARGRPRRHRPHRGRRGRLGYRRTRPPRRPWHCPRSRGLILRSWPI